MNKMTKRGPSDNHRLDLFLRSMFQFVDLPLKSDWFWLVHPV